MQDDSQRQAALGAIRDYQRGELSAGPLGDMANWVESGAPPKAEILRRQGFTQEGPADPLAAFSARMARRAFIRDWGFSIPCAEAAAALAQLGPLVEIGAGAGYWTAMLRAAGQDVIATDPAAVGDIGYGFDAGRHCVVEALSAREALSRYPDRDVFCSWPTQDGSWPLGAAWQMRPGRTLALVEGRVTGTAGLRRYLATRFDLLAEVVIPQFPGCDDRLRIYRKR